MRLARRMLAMGMLGPSYPPVTAYYSSPGGASDYMDAATNAAARAIFSGSAPVGTVLAWGRALGGDVLSVKDAVGDTAPGIVHSPSLDALDVTLNSDSDSATAFNYAADPTGSEWCLVGSVVDGTTVYSVLNERGVGEAYPSGTFAAADVFEVLPELQVGNVCQPCIIARALSSVEIAAIYAAGPTVDIRNTIGAVDFLWRDADTAGSVANVGTGAACALTIHGSVTSEAL